MKNTNKQNFYYHGKFFDTFEEMVEYSIKWPDLPFDAEYFKEFLNMRIQEAEVNRQACPHITNREAFRLLKANLEWVEK